MMGTLFTSEHKLCLVLSQPEFVVNLNFSTNVLVKLYLLRNSVYKQVM